MALLDILIRLVSIVAKSIFLLFAAKYLDVEEFGLLVTVQANVSIFQYLIGGDFGYFSQRKIIAGDLSIGEAIGTHSTLIVITSMVASVLLLYTLPRNITFNFYILVFVLTIAECLSSEAQRILVCVSRFTSANILYFLKSGSWVCIIFFGWITNRIDKSVVSVLELWCLGNLSSIVFGWIVIKSYSNTKLSFDSATLLNYLRVVPIILLGTIATRAFFSVDRIIVEKLGGLSVVGEYGFYVGIASAYIAILDAGVLSRVYPKIVKLVAENEFAKCKSAINICNLKILSLLLVSLSTMYLFLDPLLAELGKQSYGGAVEIGVVLMCAYAVFALGHSPNCILYAKGFDVTISILNVLALLPFVAVVIHKGFQITAVISYAVLTGALFYTIPRIYISKKVMSLN